MLSLTPFALTHQVWSILPPKPFYFTYFSPSPQLQPSPKPLSPLTCSTTPSSFLVLRWCCLLPQSLWYAWDPQSLTWFILSLPSLSCSTISLGKPCMTLPKIRSRPFIKLFQRITFLLWPIHQNLKFCTHVGDNLVNGYLCLCCPTETKCEPHR